MNVIPIMMTDGIGQLYACSTLAILPLQELGVSDVGSPDLSEIDSDAAVERATRVPLLSEGLRLVVASAGADARQCACIEDFVRLYLCTSR